MRNNDRLPFNNNMRTGPDFELKTIDIRTCSKRILISLSKLLRGDAYSTLMVTYFEHYVAVVPSEFLLTFIKKNRRVAKRRTIAKAVRVTMNV